MTEQPTPSRAARHIVNRARREQRDWFQLVTNKAEASGQAVAEVKIYDEIGFWGTTAADFASMLAGLEVDVINLAINSPGGEVYDGIAILNALRNHDATVNVTVDGIAASAASFIAMAGDTVTMARNSELMIHDANGLVIGGPDDMADFAERLNRMSDNIASIYAERAGGTVEDWRALMKAETWFSAQEAVDAGLADAVQEPKSDPSEQKAKNRFDLSIFNYAGRSSAPAPQAPAAASADGIQGNPTHEGSSIVAFSDESTATLRQKLGLNDEADEATILAALDEALDERVEPQATTNTAPALPEGVVTIDEAQLEQLRNAAELGRQAHERQEREGREAIVDSAIKDGRIAPARREAWLNRLAADPAEAETLNSLEKGLAVPVNELGTASGSEAHVDDDAYPAHWKR